MHPSLLSIITSSLCTDYCVSVCAVHSFGKQLGGRRGCECITLEPSEMIVVSIDAFYIMFFPYFAFGHTDLFG